MLEENEYLLVMTSCINPSGSSANVVRADPLVRLEDYKKGLKFWLGLEDTRICNILFIENSGYSLDSLKRVYQENNELQKKCEFVSLKLNSIPSGLHYGYAELNMLDEGLAQSKLFSDSNFKYIIKATGRLIFPGISSLISRLPKRFKIAVDTRSNLDLYFVHRRAHVTTQLMIFSVDFYKQFLHRICHQMTPTKLSLIETLLYEKLTPLHGQPGIILRWPCNTEPLGTAGNGKSYGALQQKAIRQLRSVSRVILPNWWL